MSAATSLEPRDPQLPQLRSAVRALPRRQAAWVGAQAVAAVGLALSGLWVARPEIALSLALAVGVLAVNPRKWWSFPLVATAVVAGGLAMGMLSFSPVLGAAAVAGALATWLLPEPTDLVDALHGGLASSALAALGLWATVQLVPDALLSTPFGAGIGGGLIGLFASQGLVPVAFRFQRDGVPSLREIRKALLPRYRPPVFSAIDLFRHAAKRAPDLDARRGLAEVATWVFRLQVSNQSLDKELTTIDVDDVKRRIGRLQDTPETDEFTRERRLATARHLERLLEHREAIDTERRRTEALVEYATAFLEEARAGLVVASELPGEAAPDRLDEVLHRLRTHAAAGNARRDSVREINRVSGD